MAQNKRWSLHPTLLTTTLTTNILNPPTFSGGVPATSVMQNGQYVIVDYMLIKNNTGTAATVSLYKGATGANASGTEWIVPPALSIAANSSFEWRGKERFDIADFLVGGAGTATALVILLEGEVGVAG